MRGKRYRIMYVQSGNLKHLIHVFMCDLCCVCATVLCLYLNIRIHNFKHHVHHCQAGNRAWRFGEKRAHSLSLWGYPVNSEWVKGWVISVLT